ncbi:MAG: hypothetical protein A3B74_04300 [Candidatus Kerfeldbacteria bacterium RIFCSPHIGHO2_02_FULL_42_14]|uniref:Uncharacterized protein n=1 Tax=Candidatus Kerfeldbacteria bacterium RIFCSPHIGHO2_02_FULL_42_14 TaxID=1798540 RepID=A0A1G2ANS5_9BACT|nr:MAG: hypothetical protein A3B74_04300 [Candidatus Kerfeldbacteria bacterium RIFCSPHIGHO2_02_FULL_42_14]OGY80844.1 MAG: hypothetical protein A3E60_01525 [Candidatus Kerfeldbacteria bacterium RIFCSPHIGHO2_12_FULL_42_13]OGY85016.1 MAG: hypothetical protein A3I91_00860 [Candidatus Kerfeldbacteria bacterium RIFCSPLOWO2_02_FULL_42_19]
MEFLYFYFVYRDRRRLRFLLRKSICIKVKEEKDSQFRNTDSAQCAEKARVCLLFFMIKMYFSQMKA